MHIQSESKLKKNTLGDWRIGNVWWNYVKGFQFKKPHGPNFEQICCALGWKFLYEKGHKLHQADLQALSSIAAS